MEPSPTPWIEALRASHDTLSKLVEPLVGDQLQQPSYASDWSIAQVLSHLGSQAEIFSLFLDAGLNGEDPPRPDGFAPIWDAWNARSPQAQADDALRFNEALVERFEALSPEQHERFRLQLFGMDLDTSGLARLRLAEHAVHTWDVAVALDPAATIAQSAVSLLVDAIAQTAARTGKPDGKTRQVHIATSSPERHFNLEIAESVTLAVGSPDGSPPALQLPAEAFIRLVYGRLDPAHTPPVAARGVELDELRGVFPGF
jgi:uncharacterized protein (TIGR03083 family)